MTASKYTWQELCALEAARRASAKARIGKRFDADIFQAVAKYEFKKLMDETEQERREGGKMNKLCTLIKS